MRRLVRVLLNHSCRFPGKGSCLVQQALLQQILGAHLAIGLRLRLHLHLLRQRHRLRLLRLSLWPGLALTLTSRFCTLCGAVS